MKIEHYISILMCLTLTSCKGQIDDINRAHEIVEQAKQEIRTEEFQSEQRKIQNSESTKNSFIEQIENSNSDELIKSKNEVLAISDSLKEILVNSKELLIAKHGLDENGNIKNESEIKHVNQVFIKENRAKKIKQQFIAFEKEFLDVLSHYKFGFTNEDIPLKLNLFMEKEGKSWEAYTFQDMPTMALLPVISKLNNDVILTELLILEKLVSRMSTDDNK